MIAEFQIRQWLARYLSDAISLEQFEDWLARESWNMHLDSAAPAQQLASTIELRLAEHSSGHLNEDELRAELSPLVTTYSATLYLGHSEVFLPSTDAQSISPTPRVFVIQAEPLFRALSDTERAAVSL